MPNVRGELQQFRRRVDAFQTSASIAAPISATDECAQR
jgi:hypothetical protein